jgi:FAD synthetase
MKRVMVFGTFDILHPGHIYFLDAAKKYGDFLIVSVAREKYVRKRKKRKPVHSEQDRKKMVTALESVDKVVLGSTGDYIRHIVGQKPDVVCLGYDQQAFTKDLKKKLIEAGLKKVRIVRLKSYKPSLYKSNRIMRKK